MSAPQKPKAGGPGRHYKLKDGTPATEAEFNKQRDAIKAEKAKASKGDSPSMPVAGKAAAPHTQSEGQS